MLMLILMHVTYSRPRVTSRDAPKSVPPPPSCVATALLNDHPLAKQHFFHHYVCAAASVLSWPNDSWWLSDFLVWLQRMLTRMCMCACAHERFVTCLRPTMCKHGLV